MLERNETSELIAIIANVLRLPVGPVGWVFS
jgi:hypothetical protein